MSATIKQGKRTWTERREFIDYFAGFTAITVQERTHDVIVVRKVGYTSYEAAESDADAAAGINVQCSIERGAAPLWTLTIETDSPGEWTDVP